MKNKNLYSLLTLTIVFVFIFSLFSTVNVLADDATPPPAAVTQAPVVPDATDPPAATDVPAATQAPVATEVPVTTDVPATTDATIATDVSTQETTNTQEVLDQLPANTTLVILDENGQPEPLATQNAANIFVNGDPMWCPGTTLPGGAGCTSGYHSFNDLITELQSGPESGSGTIYVSYDYSTSDPLATTSDASNDIIFDYGSVALTDLVVQGGWDFGSNAVIGTSSIVGAKTFQFWDWGGYGEPASLTINNIIFDGGHNNGTGVYIGPDPNGDDWVDGNVALNNVSVNASDYGAYIYTDSTTSGSGAVTVTGGDFTNNKSTGLTIGDDGYNVWWDYNPGGYSWGYDTNGPVTGDVSISNATFSENYAGSGNGNGLEVYSYGNITLDNISANENWNIGAILDNSCGCTTSNIFVSSSNFNTNGQSDVGRGLIAHSNGDITLTSISANENSGGGAELINCFFDLFGSNTCLNTNPNPATIILNGINTFNYNGYNPPQFFGGPYASVGLWVGSRDGVTVSGITAMQNGVGDFGGGALFFAENGNLSISNSIFNENCMDCGIGFGFAAINLGGDITLNKVTADGTGNQAAFTPSEGVGGIILNLSGNTFINNSDFSNNCTIDDCSGAGIFILSAAGDVTLDHVTANGNGTNLGGGVGAVISPGGNINITCSTFNNNFGDGLDANISGTMTLNGVTLSGNTIAPLDFAGGTLIQNPSDCGGSQKKLLGLSLNIVHVTNGQTVELDCEHFSGTKLILENGDGAILPCPIADAASLTDEGKDGLSGPLPDGTVFQSGFTLVVSEKGETKSKLSKSATVSFVIPKGMDTSKLSILFWDDTKWVDVGGFNTGDGHFEASVNFTGTFVLVQK